MLQEGGLRGNYLVRVLSDWKPLPSRCNAELNMKRLHPDGRWSIAMDCLN